MNDRKIIYLDDAIDAIKKNAFRLTFAEEQNCEGRVAWSAEAVYSDVMEGALLELPPAQPERKAEELMPDGTLHLFTDTDLSKVNRVLVSQDGTQLKVAPTVLTAVSTVGTLSTAYGDLYYADDDFQNCGADMCDAERGD